MVGLGIILLIFAVGVVALPRLGPSLDLLQFVGGQGQLILAVVLAATGLMLIVVGLRRRRTSDVQIGGRK